MRKPIEVSPGTCFMGSFVRRGVFGPRRRAGIEARFEQHAMRLTEYVEKADEADSLERLVGLLKAVSGELGFDRFAYCSLRSEQRRNNSDEPPVIVHNFPESWSQRYTEQGYVHHDPVVVYAHEFEKPYLWDSLGTMFALDAVQNRLMREAREAGLKCGVAVPLHGARARLSLMSFASSDTGIDAVGALPTLHMIASKFHTSYLSMSAAANDATAVVLSPRERECLQWTARGKTAWEVGMLMRISENTVKFHLRNAMKKLDSTTSVQAVVKAIRYGLISLDAQVGRA